MPKRSAITALEAAVIGAAIATFLTQACATLAAAASIAANNAFSVIVTTLDDESSSQEHESSMLFLYFKCMDLIAEADQEDAMHPGRGNARFGIRASNNPLPKMNVCHFYEHLPDKFQMLCGYSPTEFYALLDLVKAKMLLPRNGFCAFSDEAQASRVPKVSIKCKHVVRLCVDLFTNGFVWG